MRSFCLIVCLLCLSAVKGQTNALVTPKLQAQLDSILVEGNLLFSYEIATWMSTDLAMAHPEVKEKFGSYLTYQTGDSIRVIILGNNLEKCMAEYTFASDYYTPDNSSVKERALTTYEKKLIYVRERILNNLTKEEYQIRIPDGFNLNFVLLPDGKKYKMYILTGTSQHDVIPFGNDYLFMTDEDGNIEKWRKFHTRLIPLPTKHEGEPVREIIHSHTSSNPLISATDICTFMLYGPLGGLKQFSVYGGGRYMIYDLESNTVRISEKND